MHTWCLRQSLKRALNGTCYHGRCQTGNQWLVSCIDNCICRQASHAGSADLSLSLSLTHSVSLSRAIRSSLHYSRQLVWFYPTSLLHVDPTRDSCIMTCIYRPFRSRTTSGTTCRVLSSMKHEYVSRMLDATFVNLLIRDYANELSLASV